MDQQTSNKSNAAGQTQAEAEANCKSGDPSVKNASGLGPSQAVVSSEKQDGPKNEDPSQSKDTEKQATFKNQKVNLKINFQGKEVIDKHLDSVTTGIAQPASGGNGVQNPVQQKVILSKESLQNL